MLPAGMKEYPPKAFSPIGRNQFQGHGHILDWNTEGKPAMSSLGTPRSMSPYGLSLLLLLLLLL